MTKFKLKNSYKNLIKKTASFSIVEIVVIVAVIVIITGIILLRFPSFHNTVALRNTAYDVALSIRKSQSDAASIRQFESVASPGYGIYLSPANDNSSYIVFVDKNEDGIYDSDDDEILETVQLKNGHTLEAFCLTDFCTTHASFYNSAHITFPADSLEPSIAIGTLWNTTFLTNELDIILRSNRGSKNKRVRVYTNSAGKIETENCGDVSENITTCTILAACA